MPSTTIVRSVMTSDVVTVRPDQSIPEAADVLAERSVGAAPVLDADGRLVGLLRDEDLLITEARIHLPTTIAILPGVDFTLPSSLRRYDDELRKAAGATVADVMTTEFPTIGPDDTLERAATVMHEEHVTHLPVVERDRVVGMLARADIIRFLAATT
jgi:CBS domain-containing protein